MLARTIMAVATVCASGFVAGRDAKLPDPKQGDRINLTMSGELAEQYWRLSDNVQGDWKVPAGLEISTSAEIVQQLDNGQLRVSWSSSMLEGKSPRLITLDAIIDRTQLTASTVAGGQRICSSPADAQNGTRPTRLTKLRTGFELKLSKLKGVRLRSWTLAREVSG